jgi:hypothetical protein
VSVAEFSGPKVSLAEEMKVDVVEGEGVTNTHSLASRLAEVVLSDDPV